MGDRGQVQVQMTGNTSRRRFTLEPGQAASPAEDLNLDDVEAFIEDHTEFSPELVSVTFEVDDAVRDPATTN